MKTNIKKNSIYSYIKESTRFAPQQEEAVRLFIEHKWLTYSDLKAKMNIHNSTASRLINQLMYDKQAIIKITSVNGMHDRPVALYRLRKSDEAENKRYTKLQKALSVIEDNGGIVIFENQNYKDFAKKVAEVLKDEYGSHVYNDFINELKTNKY